MNNIIVYKTNIDSAIINQVSIKRDWMDETDNRHAYHCMPVSLANTLGWAISFPEEISFIWDGISDTSADHVKILKGHKYCSNARANGTISFNTYLKFETEENITTLIMPVPNQFDDFAQCFTTLISTSFYKSELPIAWKILKSNIEICIPAKTPVAVFIPISLSNLNTFDVIIKKQDPYKNKNIFDDSKIIQEQNKMFLGLYRKAENHKGEKIGNHETRSIKLNTTEK